MGFRSHLATLCLASLMASALLLPTASAQQQQLTSATPRFKCDVLTVSGQREVIYFYSLQTLPQRFTDANTIDKAEIPGSVRADLREVYECVRADLAFEDVGTRNRERLQPK
jgi:hypothetical protein